MNQNDRRYSGEIERLRSEQRLNFLEVPQVIQHVLDQSTITSVLDVGTGSGIFAEAFAAQNLAVYGIDIREDMLEAARQFVPSGEFKIGKMEAIPYPDKAFDMVFMGLVLHEADDLLVALNEAYRIATKRTAVLEWKYQEEDFGPPIAHRLQPDTVTTTAKEVGFIKTASIDLTHLTLYYFDRRS